MRRTVITISGKVKEILKLFDLYCKKQGNKTLAEIVGEDD